MTLHGNITDSTNEHSYYNKTMKTTKHTTEPILHSCRQCAFCDWHNQYCSAKDADMGKSFMMAQKKCRCFEERKEEEE